MKAFSHREYIRCRGVALVLTLVILVMLTITVVAFTSSVRLETRAAHAFRNTARAELAADLAFTAAADLLARETASDDFIVTSAENTVTVNGTTQTLPYYYIGKPENAATGTPGTIDYIPLFSGGNSGLLNQPIDSRILPAQLFPANVTKTKAEPRVPESVTGTTQPAMEVGWITDNTIPDAGVRYCYWIEDLGGQINAELAGNKEDAGKHNRADGLDPKELALFTLFNPTAQKDPDAANGKEYELIQGRWFRKEDGTPVKDADNHPISRLISPLSLLQLGIPDGRAGGAYVADQDFARFFACGLKYNPEPEMIPRGFGYSNAGQPKLNVNASIATGGDAAVTAIADTIRTNLPQFETRKGGFPTDQDYLRTLAANLVDYADADCNATGGASYRGVDSYPFMTSIYYQFTWVNQQPSDTPWFTQGGTWQSKVQVTTWVQLWNMSDREITSGVWKLDDSADKYALFYSGSQIVACKPEPAGAPSKTIVFTSTNKLLPNEFKAFQLGPVEYTLNSGVSSAFPTPAISGTGRPKISRAGSSDAADHFDGSYEVLWNNTLVERPCANPGQMIERRAGTLDRYPASAGEGPDWRGGQPGLRHSLTFTDSLYNLGDPRSSYYISQCLSAHDYAQNASWWGRHVAGADSTSSVKDWFVGQARPHAWPDGAHDPAPALPLGAISPGDTAAKLRVKNGTTPDSMTAGRPATESTKAPTHISNAGRLSSITELGSVYDPLQWRPQSWGATTAEREANWLNVAKFPMVADSSYGMASTLRIGRPEFLTLDQWGTRAWQLLDLFSIADTSTPAGRININTASREVLRTLSAGLLLQRDPEIQPPELRNNLWGPLVSRQGDLFADAVIAARPFVSPAQLADLRSNGIPLFGNPEIWPAPRPSAWNDRAAEEYFARIYSLTTVRSRNFRIHVTAEALDRRGKPNARCRKVFQVCVVPNRNQGQAIADQQIKLIYESSL